MNIRAQSASRPRPGAGQADGRLRPVPGLQDHDVLGLRARLRAARKGTTGVSTNGVTANFMLFARGTFWVLLLTFLYLPRSARAYLFLQSVKLHYFCSGPISVDPICPHQAARGAARLVLGVCGHWWLTSHQDLPPSGCSKTAPSFTRLRVSCSSEKILVHSSASPTCSRPSEYTRLHRRCGSPKLPGDCLTSCLIPGRLWPLLQIGRLKTGCLVALLTRLTPNLCTKIRDFGGFDSSRILSLRVEFSCRQGFSRKV